MGTITPIRFLYILLVATVALLLILTFGIQVKLGINPIDDSALNGTIRYEFIKSLLQLLVVGIIGGFIKLLMDEEQNKRNKSKIISEIRTDYFKRIGSVYREVKRVRRDLRAGGLTNKYGKFPTQLSAAQSALYLDQMKQMNKSQLELEALKIEAKYLPAFIKLDDIAPSLEIMEKYIGEILKEYEEFGPSINTNSKLDTEFIRLLEFTGKIKDDATEKKEPEKYFRFKKHFSGFYAHVIESLSKNMEEENLDHIQHKKGKKYFALYLLPSRPDFSHTKTDEERVMMIQHAGYWTQLMNRGKVVAFGPVSDPKEAYSLVIISVDSEKEVKDFIENDPAAKIKCYEYFPMKAVVPALFSKSH